MIDETREDRRKGDEDRHGGPAPSQPADGAGRTDGEAAGRELPAAGPHARPDLTRPLATPGAGTLPDPGDPDGTDSTAG